MIKYFQKYANKNSAITQFCTTPNQQLRCLQILGIRSWYYTPHFENDFGQNHIKCCYSRVTATFLFHHPTECFSKFRHAKGTFYHLRKGNGVEERVAYWPRWEIQCHQLQGVSSTWFSPAALQVLELGVFAKNPIFFKIFVNFRGVCWRPLYKKIRWLKSWVFTLLHFTRYSYSQTVRFSYFITAYYLSKPPWYYIWMLNVFEM